MEKELSAITHIGFSLGVGGLGTRWLEVCKLQISSCV